MIERKFVAERKKEFMVQEYIGDFLENVGYSKTKLVKTPLGEKVIVFASRPGLIVGKKGANIKQLTKSVKTKFNLENPEVEIAEVSNPSNDADIIAEKIVSFLERFGTQKFKAIAHKIMMEVMGAGALGIELTISGKVPSSRAKTWRFYQGYLKKSGDVSLTGVRKAHKQAQLKTGVVGIQVKIMPGDTQLPDDINVLSEAQLAKRAEAETAQQAADSAESASTEQAAEKKPAKKKSARKSTKAKAPKKDAKETSASEQSSEGAQSNETQGN